MVHHKNPSPLRLVFYTCALCSTASPLIYANIRLLINVVDRRLGTDKGLECNYPRFHSTYRPKFNMAPTKRAKSDREEAIQRAPEKRKQENESFDDLALEFGIVGQSIWILGHPEFRAKFAVLQPS